jgi:serine/threonine protein kinase/WD40 repeat protein
MDERTIFERALDLDDPQERAAFLDEACGREAALRSRVDALLRSHEQAADFLAGVAAAEREEFPYQPISEAPGTVIGRYKLLEQIGEGGFAFVFMAEQEEPVRRKVALKIIKPGMDTKEVIARFEAERQALAMMDHPKIAMVLDAGATESGRPYFVMELVRGIPITEFCDRNSFTAPERLELFLAVCQAVQHAHQKGIIHRDIKPTNVMVTMHDDRPVPKVIDFGVAKAMNARLTERTLFTRFVQMVGTPLYMSPEQAQMSGLDVDTRSDIYSLGVLLYELLTGTTPFDQKRIREAAYEELLKIIREDEPPRPSERVSTLNAEALSTIAEHRRIDARKLKSSLRGELDWIVMKALEKDRTRRYETVAALAADVAASLNHEPIQARPPSAAYRLQKFAKRNRLAIFTGALVAGALLLGTVVSALQAFRATRAEALAADRLAAVEQAERRKSEMLWEAYLSQARARRRTELAGRRFESLAALTKAARLLADMEFSPQRIQELRNEWIACSAVQADLRIAKEVPYPPGEFGMDPQHERYVVASAEGELILHRTADDREVLRIPGHAKDYWAIRFSSNGRYLATRGSGISPHEVPCRVWDLAEHRPVLETDMADNCFALDFSPDSRLVAFGRNDASIYLLDLEKGQELPPLSPGPTRPFRLAFSPRGDRLAVHNSGGNCELHIRDVKSGETMAVFSHPSMTDGYVDWNADGTLVAVTCGDCVYVWNVQSGEVQSVLRGHRWMGVNAAFSRTDDLLLSRGWDGTTRLGDPWTGVEIVHSRGGLMGFQFRRDGRQAAFYGGAGAGGVWDVAISRTHRRLALSVPKGQERHSAAIHQDGRVLAAGSDDGMRLYDLHAGREVALLPIGACYSTIFHPDDGSLITSAPAGLYRWPISIDRSAGTLQIDPPQRLTTFPPTWRPLAASSSGGQYLAAIAGSDVVVRDLDQKTDRCIPAGRHTRFKRFVAEVLYWKMRRSISSLNVNILPVFGRTRASFDQRATANFQAVAQEFRISKP